MLAASPIPAIGMNQPFVNFTKDLAKSPKQSMACQDIWSFTVGTLFVLGPDRDRFGGRMKKWG
jgi:hypothetical protein